MSEQWHRCKSWGHAGHIRGADDAEILWRPGWDESLPIDTSFEVRLQATEQ